MSNRSAPRLPYSTPAWLTPNRIAMAAISAFAASAALPAVWWIPPARSEIGGNPASAAAVAASTALLSLLLAFRALRAESVTKAALWSVFGGLLAGVLNAGLSCGAVEFVSSGDFGGAVVDLLAGLFIGGFLGGPLGLVFGLAYAVLIAGASRAQLSPSHDGPDRVLLTAGVWLLLGGGALIQLTGDSPAPLPPITLVALGIPAVVVSILRLEGRKRWLDKVARGLVPAFRIEKPAEGAEIPKHLLPIVRQEPWNSLAILSYLYNETGSPYRGSEAGLPIALAQMPPQNGEPLSPASAEGAESPKKSEKSKSPASTPRRKLGVELTLGSQLRSLAADIFVVVTKTIGISLVLLVFAVALAIPFVSCASAMSLESYDLH